MTNDSFEIDQIAQNIFNTMLPASWLKRPQSPDVHVDYSVEIREDMEPTGKVFYVQLKGCVSPKYSNEFLKYSLKKKHLEYYLDKLKLPVFLIVVDVSKKVGYWIFLQKYLNELPPSRKWRKNGSLTIKVPLNNDISDIEKLTASITMAEVYMREIWPSSINSAIQSEKQKLEKLDNRFSIDVAYKDQTTHYTLLPNTNVNCQFQFGSKSVSDKFNHLINTGKDVEFKNGDLKIAGSKLLENIFNSHNFNSLKISSGKQLNCTILLAVFKNRQQEPDKEPLFAIPIHDCLLKGGKKEFNFSANLNKSPLNLSGYFPLGGNLSGNFNISFDYSIWYGQKILHLNYFDYLFKLYKYLADGKILGMIVEHNGNRIIGSFFDSDLLDKLVDDIMAPMTFLYKTRSVCRHLQVNPTLPHHDCITEDDYDSIEQIYKIIKDGKHEQQIPNSYFNAKFNLPNNLLIDTLEKSTDTSEIQFHSSLIIYGETSDKYALRQNISKITLSDKTKDLLKNITDTQPDVIDTEWITNNDSVLTKELAERNEGLSLIEPSYIDPQN